MGAAVLLLHRRGDGTSHYDWMIQRGEAPGEGTGGGTLVTFRVQDRIDSGAVPGFQAVRIADHRPEYLRFEGEVSGGRGRVERVAEGELRIEHDGGRRFRCRGRLGSARGVFEGEEGGPGRWTFRFAADG